MIRDEAQSRMAVGVPISLEEQIAEVERELKLRQRIYPRWVSGRRPKLNPPAAAQQLARLTAVRETLVGLLARERREAERGGIDEEVA